MQTNRRDESTRELLQARLKLNADVKFWPEHYGNRIWYHVESAQHGKFFRVGQAEYTFISLLDGQTSLGEAISLTAYALGPDALTEDQAATIVTWLLDNQLAEATEHGVAIHSPRTSGKQWAKNLNPFWLKVPFGNPNRLLDNLQPWFGWIHSWPAILISLTIWAVALTNLLTNWGRFTNSSRTILAPENWLSLSLAWLFLKVVHELSHALACKRHGGEVRETGLIFILLAPVAFVDVTSSLRFRSKWQRMQVAAAGMYVEITVASIALLAWNRADSEIVRHILYNVVVMASLTTLLFNANPLMKFDGYYILSDLTEIPNLYTRGAEFVRRISQRMFVGMSSAKLQEAGLRGTFVRAYGLAAFFWRLLVCAGLLIAAAALFQGLGIVLAVLGLCMWTIRPALDLGRLLLRLLHTNPIQLARAGLATAFAISLAAFALLCTPWPAGRTAPGYVEYQDRSVPRADSSGFVREIRVRDGQLVSAGELLVQLENRELASEVIDLALAVEQSTLRYHGHLREKNATGAQVEAENRQALRERLIEKTRQRDALSIRATTSGRVLARQLDWKRDTFIERGAEILTIGTEARKEFRASLSQEDRDSLAAGGKDMQIRLRSTEAFSATARRVDPRASNRAPHDALTVVAGGDLAVRPTDDRDSDNKYELIEPRFTADFSLPQQVASEIPVGTTGIVTLRPRKYDSLGEGIYWSINNWLEAQIKSAFAS